ncbi:hypothetical protein R1sor_020567 [Riccia sorocarpa]|uniref:Tubulin-specific chaperone C N-terminal domain-containing protein n=1 Tax=Riccia sorocarpa TaxID=122646 RepID=A0ABD3IJK5_9MARC
MPLRYLLNFLSRARVHHSKITGGRNLRPKGVGGCFFLNQRKESVEKGLTSALEKKDALEQTLLKEHLDSLALELSDMEKLVADSSYFLPAYDVRSSQAAVLRLKEELASASTELLPKKKFSFRNKAAKKQPISIAAADSTIGQIRDGTHNIETNEENRNPKGAVSESNPASPH